MWLSAPKVGQAPKPDRSQKGVFTNRPAPKIKVWKPPKDETADGLPPAPPPNIETPFVVWLREKKTSAAWHIDATKEYLLQGPPYRGDSQFDSKDALKELGTKWMWNPLKKKECQDKTIKKGWWSAPGEAILVKLLEMEHAGGRRQWEPLDMGETQIGVALKWLLEFLGDEAPQDAKAVKEAAEDLRPDAKRQKCNSDVDPGLQHILEMQRTKPMKQWVLDTVCKKCGHSVLDQFMDCACLEAQWVRCSLCQEKKRVDNDGCPPCNAACKCR